MKSLMASTNAIFGGEHSAHYYFRDFWSADTGMLAALHVLARLGKSKLTMSRLIAELPNYPASGEINTAVIDQAAAMKAVELAFADLGTVSYPDGLMITAPDWWVNVRPSNTEPLLRLNVEAKDEKMVTWLRERALAVIRGGGTE